MSDPIRLAVERNLPAELIPVWLKIHPADRFFIVSILGIEAVPQWLATPNEALGYRTPLEVIEAGEASAISDAIERLKMGAFS